LPKDQLIFARTQLLRLQLTTRRFGEALNTYALLEEASVDTSAFDPVIERVNQLKQDDSIYSVDMKMDEMRRDSLRLFKRGFLIEQEGNSIPRRCCIA
jgi:hypothetical protein